MIINSLIIKFEGGGSNGELRGKETDNRKHKKEEKWGKGKLSGILVVTLYVSNIHIGWMLE